MELYIEQDEYLPDIADAAGVRVVIHDQTDMPFPEDLGFSVQPGVASSIGISMVKIMRVMSPYGNCKNFTDAENAQKNAFVESLDFVKYSMEACKKTCYQKNVIEECKCADSQFPSTGKALRNTTNSLNIGRLDSCSSSNDTQKHCMERVERMFISDNLGCSAMCPPPCLQHNYQRQMSYSQYPSENKEAGLLDQLTQLSQSVYNTLTALDKPSQKDFARRNLVKLEIYYATLDYDTIITKASYEEMDVLSDIGGQVGLWLGLSIITLFEGVEFLVDICKLCAKKTMGRKKKVGDDGRPQSREAFK